MEYKDNIVIHNKDCGKPRIKEECFKQIEIIESKSSAVDSKTEIKQGIWDANVPSGDVQSNHNQPSTCQETDIIKVDSKEIKEEHVLQYEISPEPQKLCLQQIETYFAECNESSDVDSKVGIKQEAWDGVPHDFKRNPEQLLSSDLVLSPSTDALNAGDEIDIKQEPCWVEGTSADSMNEGEGNNSRKNEAAQNVSLLESLRPYTGAVYSSSAIRLQKNKGTSSLSIKSNTAVQKCQLKHMCAVCGKSFKWLSHLQKHNLIHNCTYSDVLNDLVIHNLRRQYICDTCGKTFLKVKYLKKHLLVHDDKRLYECQVCDKSFKQLFGLKRHLLVHDDKRHYKCEVCEKSFKDLPRLKKHFIVHDDKRQHKCQICAKSFKRRADLKAHLLVHNNKRECKCKICEKSFKRLEDLKSHLLVHDDKRQYKCQICEKSFKYLRALKSHLLVHDDQRQYKCQICEKSFKRLHGLKKHLLVHDDRRQYECKICEKSFKQLYTLKRHFTVHDEKRK